MAEPLDRGDGPVADDVWLLTGNRPGERAQQRAVAQALGLPFREIAVATMAPSGKGVRFDFDALHAPWPRLAIAFGKTLAAAAAMRDRGANATRVVQLGLPRRWPVDALDLVVPMPTDQYVDAPNVLRVRMPFNATPAMAADAPAAERLLASGLPRPWIGLVVGGNTSRTRLLASDARAIAAAASQRARSLGGSVLATTSPRTPGEAIDALREGLAAPGELHVFDAARPSANPYAAYLAMADELIVTGDSASMVAECWRSGKPLRVAMPRRASGRRIAHALRALVPTSMLASGRVSGDVDIVPWLLALERDGRIGVLGRSEPRLPYAPQRDDDLARTVARIRELLEAAP